VVSDQTKIIKGRIFTAQIIEGDIFNLYFFPNEHAMASDFKAGYDAYNTLRNGELLKLIIEHGEYTIIDTSAREYLQKNKFEAICSAIVMHSIAQRIIYNFYIKFRKQNYPIKAFKSKKKAIDWLKKF
jgi:hypothetical protein